VSLMLPVGDGVSIRAVAVVCFEIDLRACGSFSLFFTEIPGKHTEADSSAAKQLDSPDQLLSRKKPGLSLETKIDLEKRKRNDLINEHNRLKFAVKEKEARLKTLQKTLQTMDAQPAASNTEDACRQRIRQLENNLDKMKVKITEAREIQTAYGHIRENLQQEVRDIYGVLEQREQAVAVGQAKLDKASKQSQTAAAATGCTLGRVLQMECETMGKKREMDLELCVLSAEEKELKRQMETLGQLSTQRLREQYYDQQCYDVCGASRSDMKLMEDMEALREALGCADVQELVSKVVSQQATQQDLLSEVTRCEELTRQEDAALTQLHLQHAELKFSSKPAASRFDGLKGEMEAELNQEVFRVRRLHGALQQSQDLLATVERGVNNLYFRMSCVPVQELSSASCTESLDKVKDISNRLPTLLQRASQHKAEISGLDQERVHSLLEQLNRMESRNVKRPSTPIHSPEVSDDEDECCPSRDEIKSNSMRLVESEQSKSSSRRGKRKQ
ncbi:Coiled-coil domain containing protein 183, partial [Dissostichus eleginoides]